MDLPRDERFSKGVAERTQERWAVQLQFVRTRYRFNGMVVTGAEGAGIDWLCQFDRLRSLSRLEHRQECRNASHLADSCSYRCLDRCLGTRICNVQLRQDGIQVLLSYGQRRFNLRQHILLRL